MGAVQTDNESGQGQWSFIASILGVVLITALIWFLSRAPNNSAPQDSVAPANEAAALNTVLSQEEIERRERDIPEQEPAPVIRSPVAAQPAVSPTKETKDAVVLQKAKTRVNQQIVDRMKQFVKDHPNRDNRGIEKEIKKREDRDAQSQ